MNLTFRIFLTVMLVSLITTAINAAPPELINDRPNVVLIYADDLGIGMLGAYGQQIVKTPNIDQLAAEGMKFNNYYGGTFCAPARWTLLTGNARWSQRRMGSYSIRLADPNGPTGCAR